jgi:hypothetical protein
VALCHPNRRRKDIFTVDGVELDVEQAVQIGRGRIGTSRTSTARTSARKCGGCTRITAPSRTASRMSKAASIPISGLRSRKNHFNATLASTTIRRRTGVPSGCALRYSPLGRPGGLMAGP